MILCERHGLEYIVEPGGPEQPSINGRTYCPGCQAELMAALDIQPDRVIENREVVVDDRGRISLSGLVDKHSIYQARRFGDGSIILEPAAVRRAS